MKILQQNQTSIQQQIIHKTLLTIFLIILFAFIPRHEVHCQPIVVYTNTTNVTDPLTLARLNGEEICRNGEWFVDIMNICSNEFPLEVCGVINKVCFCHSYSNCQITSWEKKANGDFYCRAVLDNDLWDINYYKEYGADSHLITNVRYFK